MSKLRRVAGLAKKYPADVLTPFLGVALLIFAAAYGIKTLPSRDVPMLVFGEVMGYVGITRAARLSSFWMLLPAYLEEDHDATLADGDDVFTNGDDYVIARDARDASAIYSLWLSRVAPRPPVQFRRADTCDLQVHLPDAHNDADECLEDDESGLCATCAPVFSRESLIRRFGHGTIIPSSLIANRAA